MKITREQLESLESKYKLVHQSEELNKGFTTDYYDLWEFPGYRLEVDTYKNKTLCCLYQINKNSIDIKYEGKLEELNDIVFIINKCI